MEPMSSPDPVTGGGALSSEHRGILLDLVSQSIAYGLRNGTQLEIDASHYPDPMKENRACFVTLKINGRLRGCIGSLEAIRPLVVDVVNNAYKAAFADPRFPPLTEGEFREVDSSLSVLDTPESLSFRSEEDLISRLRPGIDGLILKEGKQYGTFLPSLWETLKDPSEFLKELKRKAGLPLDYWSDSIRIQRYTVETVERDKPFGDLKEEDAQ